MEDEDGESKKDLDMWNILDETPLRDPTLSSSLKHSIDNDIYTDVIEENQLPHYNSVRGRDSPAKNTVTNSSKFPFKGFKKRILAQTREVHPARSKTSAQESAQQPTHPNAKGRDKKTEGKRERKIAEYAQYLGLQPSTKYKCSKCGTACGSNLRPNSCSCNSNMTPMPGTSESSGTSVPHVASNFKITRKVYLCSACGTYFENWNLFLHMRDIHKRHICLFCLGMFGQAERLSYHLLKKHSVPEMTFDSVEDFYKTFKGSCYLVCCTCEKDFSETDDFYNHYCPPIKQDAADTGSSVCTICRQICGTHAATCNLAAASSDTDKELSGTATPLSIADTTRADSESPATVPLPEKTARLGGKGLPRKEMKYRDKHRGDGAQNFRQQKQNTLARKLSNSKARCNENQLVTDVQKEVANNLPRDTITETIMEVSRYKVDSSDENDENDEQAMNKDVLCGNYDKGSVEKSPMQNCQLDRNEPYDSVTQTIMEVSRAIHTDETEKRDENSAYTNVRASRVEKIVDDEETCDKSDIDPICSTSSKAPSPERSEVEEVATVDAKSNTTRELGTESGFRSYDSPQDAQSQSPVPRSLFSPQHESHVSDSQSKEKETYESVDKEEEDDEEEEEKEKPVASSTVESQASVSFNATAPSDRSLVIKICSRNSQFSVATAVPSKESEENNNAEGSTSKEMSNGSEKVRDIMSDQAIELDDSDSDSDKLAVVDSNPEESEEAEEENEKDKYDAKNEVNQEETDGIVIGASNDGTFSIAETAPSDNVGETIGNNVDGRTEMVANDQPSGQPIGDSSSIALAGEDAPYIDLNIEGTLDSMELEDLLKRCIETASPFCVYCNHARHIAVNGKQLSLHMLAEHKFQPQHPAIIIHAEQFTARVKRSLDELENRYFNLGTYNTTNGTYNVPAVLIYECFHCRFHTAVHKELYLHNRKMHQKPILICIMCKSTFYSYSELLCHLCPGVYSSETVNLRYRCCFCTVATLPSAFRLMVHLRKRHHICDVCLEATGNQQRLSNHVWKHKLNHMCHRCDITYRNKPDITKHLFWKHGTESVLCRKCLQKKWPHIYHFCIPPTAFVCDECSVSFSRAVALKVHKRLHSGDLPYGCDECSERFISRKLLAKHQEAHKEEKIHVDVVNVSTDKEEVDASTVTDSAAATAAGTVETAKPEAVKRVVDVYDLPPLNLSSESDTDTEDEKSADKPTEKEKSGEENIAETSKTVEETVDDAAGAVNEDIADEVERNEEEKKKEARIMDGIWDNFKTYAASLDVEESAKNVALKESVPETDAAYLRSIILTDHDYCVVYSDPEKTEDGAAAKDNDAKDEQRNNVKSSAKTPSPTASPNRNADSGSSSDSDSSACSSSNCSCSSNSSDSSSSDSSSDSESSESSSKKRSGDPKERKKEKETSRENKSQSVEPETKPTGVTTEHGSAKLPEVTSEPPAPPPKPLLRESDLETEETETDEDFYDENPKLHADQILTEKRNQLLASVAPALTPTSLTPASQQPLTPLNNGIVNTEAIAPLESIAMTVEDQRPQQQSSQKKKIKTKKRRKGERVGNKRNATSAATPESIKLNIPKTFYQKNPGFAASTPIHHPGSRSSTPNLLPTCNDLYGGVTATMDMMHHHQQQVSSAATVTSTNQNSTLEQMENKRVSKRKRVPKRFYGDSSDDEPHEKQQSFGRWRKNDAVVANVPVAFAPSLAATPAANPKPVAPPKITFSAKSVAASPYGNRLFPPPEQATIQQAPLPETLPVAASATESDDPGESSSESSESEAETEQVPARIGIKTSTVGVQDTATTGERNSNVTKYCYCRCPYDEMSEMIACDGANCRIEWFHFECVGIMVPPRGKWYCPDCRKKHGIVQNNDDYCD